MTEVKATATKGYLSLDNPTFLQPRSGEATVELAYALRWGGVSEVLNAQGRTVTARHVSPASGTDYSHAIFAATVPEPASVSMWLLGLGGVGLWLRRLPVIQPQP